LNYSWENLSSKIVDLRHDCLIMCSSNRKKNNRTWYFCRLILIVTGDTNNKIRSKLPMPIQMRIRNLWTPLSLYCPNPR